MAAAPPYVPRYGYKKGVGKGKTTVALPPILMKSTELQAVSKNSGPKYQSTELSKMSQLPSITTKKNGY